MANVVRLVNGGAIQVRTGVIQGIGPQGPRGVAGPQGLQGEQGPVGPAGPLGQILQSQGLGNVAANHPCTANSDVTVNFGGSIAYDDLSAFSGINVTLTATGDYMLSCWVRFDAGAIGYRDLWFQTGSTTIARTTRWAGDASNAYYVDLAFPYRATGSNIINVHVRSGTVSAVSMGSMAVTRMGSGPKGDQGIQGPQGAVGAQGIQGPAGPTGSASGGFTTYADLLP
jgi:hypothetical protein